LNVPKILCNPLLHRALYLDDVDVVSEVATRFTQAHAQGNFLAHWARHIIIDDFDFEEDFDNFEVATYVIDLLALTTQLDSLQFMRETPTISSFITAAALAGAQSVTSLVLRVCFQS
jgi:hypothetical protein